MMNGHDGFRMAKVLINESSRTVDDGLLAINDGLLARLNR